MCDGDGRQPAGRSADRRHGALDDVGGGDHDDCGGRADVVDNGHERPANHHQRRDNRRRSDGRCTERRRWRADVGLHRRRPVAQPAVAPGRTQLRRQRDGDTGHGLHADARQAAAGRRRCRRRGVPPGDAHCARQRVHHVPPLRRATRRRHGDRQRRIRSLLDCEQSHGRSRHGRDRPHHRRPRTTWSRAIGDGPHARRDRPAAVRRRRFPGRPPLLYVRLQRAPPTGRGGVAVGAHRPATDHRRRHAGPPAGC